MIFVFLAVIEALKAAWEQIHQMRRTHNVRRFHDRLFPVVHTLRNLLAPGLGRPGSLSDCVALAAPIPHCRNRSKRSVILGLGRSHASGSPPDGTVPYLILESV